MSPDLGPGYLVFPIGVFLLVIEFGFQETGRHILLKWSRRWLPFDFAQVIKPVISHCDNLMAVMRFALCRTKAWKMPSFFKWSVCLWSLIYGPLRTIILRDHYRLAIQLTLSSPEILSRFFSISVSTPIISQITTHTSPCIPTPLSPPPWCIHANPDRWHQLH